MNKLFIQLKNKRGINDDFLEPKYEDLADPFLIPGMQKAVERIKKAALKNEKILIYGDYDVDGATASAAMKEILELSGIKQIETMLPNRFTDGYGMSQKVIEKAVSMGAGLVITVDCGTSNGDIIDELSARGIDTIVTDHHEVLVDLPKAVAVINPKRNDCENQKLKELAGVGVAFKLAQALVKAGVIKDGQEKWLLDLVLIGTVCDSMKLTGENRILCYFGMKVLAKTRRVGLKELMKKSGVKTLDTEAIGFQIGPRINAAGRLETPEIALNLLNAKDGAEAAALAEKLEQLNSRRKLEQNEAFVEISKMGVADEPVIIKVGKWNEGIIGIVAGKLVEEYKKPAIVFTEVEKGILKGSGRSFGDFSLAEMLKINAGKFIKFGGHAEACGMTMSANKLDDFIKDTNDFYKSLKLVGQERFFEYQADVVTSGLSDFNTELLDEIKSLEPFGCGNEEPIFKLENVQILNVRRMGAEGQHLALNVRGEDGATMKLIAFFAPEKWFSVIEGEKYDILIRVIGNEWNGVVMVEGRIINISALKGL